jgi:maltose-binding protein MalE
MWCRPQEDTHLVNIVVDMLAILIERAKNDGQIGGLIPHLVEGVSLYYNMSMIQSFFWNMTYLKL